MPNKFEITIDLIIHATEDETKFFQIFDEFFGIKKNQFSINNLTGHFENPITLIHTKISKKLASNFINNLISKISSDQMDQLIETLHQRITKSNLYLRFDKQEFVMGKFILQEKNALKLKIFTPIYKKNEIMKTYTKLLKSSN